MSTIAVFLVLGGASAFAATQLAKNSVGSKQLKRNAVTTAKIKKNAVTAAKIKNGAVTNGKIAEGAITTGKIADEAVTGAKVNEGSLGQVPSANVANAAGSAQPEVFAKIEGDGDVVESLSKGLADANVTHPAPGVYCVTSPSFAARGAVANAQYGGTFGAVAQVTVGGTGNCPAPAVQVITSSGGVANDFTFYIVLYH
ncbi:MAG: hypothetical protein M3335_01560 [Actinomycetota bacterium]|nr:hypothetical protein [Actinomycetota bacterium]